MFKHFAESSRYSGLLLLLVFGGGLQASTISGCATDALGNPVVGAKVIAMPPEKYLGKTYTTTTKGPAGCYELRIGKNDTYFVILRDKRWGEDGPIQGEISVSGNEPHKVDLTTDTPNQKLLTEGLAAAIRTASRGFEAVRSDRSARIASDIPATTLSGFGGCDLRYVHDFDGDTASYLCITGGRGKGKGIHSEADARAIFGKVRDSMNSALASLPGLRYAESQSGSNECPTCIDRMSWISPINGAIRLAASTNGVSFWMAYNTSMAQAGCSSLMQNRTLQVDEKRYDALIRRRNDAYIADLKADLKGAYGQALGALTGTHNTWNSSTNSGTSGSKAPPEGNPCVESSVR